MGHGGLLSWHARKVAQTWLRVDCKRYGLRCCKVRELPFPFLFDLHCYHSNSTISIPSAVLIPIHCRLHCIAKATQ